jgi:hypothetical protein
MGTRLITSVLKASNVQILNPKQAALLILLNIMSSKSCLKISYFSINTPLSSICVPSLDYMTADISDISAPKQKVKKIQKINRRQ